MHSTTSPNSDPINPTRQAGLVQRFLVAMIWFVPLLLLMAALPSDAPAQEAPVCGDGILADGEDCDDGDTAWVPAIAQS